MAGVIDYVVSRCWKETKTVAMWIIAHVYLPISLFHFFVNGLSGAITNDCSHILCIICNQNYLFINNKSLQSKELCQNEMKSYVGLLTDW